MRASITTAHGDYAVDDDGLVLIEWEGGARSVVESGWWQPHLGGHEADTEVYGSSGYRRIWAREQPPGLRALRRDAVRRADARRAGADRGLAARDAVAGARPGGAAHLRAGLRSRQEYAPPCQLTARSVVAGIAGSLRRASFNRGLLRAAIEEAPDGHDDRAARDPRSPALRRRPRRRRRPGGRARVQGRASSPPTACFIATPEYNYSMPGVLKNALDWASRAPERALHAKPVAIVGATPGRWGTVRSQLALRQMLMFPACRVMPAPMLHDRRRARVLRRRGQPHGRRDARAADRRARRVRDLDSPGLLAARGNGFLDIE